MGTVDVSRFLLQTRKGFVGARLQQGRILLDSDFNEQGQLTDEDRRRAMVHVLGRHGSPDLGFSIRQPPADPDPVPDTLGIGSPLPIGTVTLGGTPLTDTPVVGIRPGTMFVGGLRFTLENPEHIAFQRDFLQMHATDMPGAASLRTFYYLHAWEQCITAVEDEEIREAMLGGAETSVRVRHMRRVEVLANLDDTIGDCEKAFAKLLTTTPLQNGELDETSGELHSKGRLQLSFAFGESADPCAPVDPLHSHYLGGENQALKIMLTTPSTFVWGLRNGTPLFKVEITGLATGSTLVAVKVLTPLTDERDWPVVNRVVEILPFAALLEGGNVPDPGPHFRKAAAEIGLFTRAETTYDPTTQKFTLEADEDMITALLGLVRAWDPVSHPDKDILNIVSDTAGAISFYMRLWHQAPTPADIQIPTTTTTPPHVLGNTGVIPTFRAAGRRGDFWTAALRVENAKQIIPLELMADGGAAPAGPRHFYAPVAFIRAANGVLVEYEDCRCRIRPVTDRICVTFTVGDGVTSFGDFTSIQDAINNLPSAGGRIAIRPGRYRENIVVQPPFDTDDGQPITNVVIEGCGDATILETDPDSEATEVVRIRRGVGVTLSNLKIRAAEQDAILAFESGTLRFSDLTLVSGVISNGFFFEDTSEGSNQSLFTLGECIGVEIERVTIRAHRRPALSIAISHRVKIDELTAQGIDVSPEPPKLALVTLSNVTDGATIRNSTLHPFGQIGLLVEQGCTGVDIRDLHVHARAHATAENEGGEITGPRPGVDIDEGTDVALRRSRVTMEAVASDDAGVVLFGRDITLDSNVIEAERACFDTSLPESPDDCFDALPLAYGGVQVRGGSKKVHIVNNHIRGGVGHGITIGSLLWQSTRQDSTFRAGAGFGQTDEDEDGRRSINGLIRETGDTLGGLSTPTIEFANDPIDDLVIERNRIEGMSTSGISVLSVLGIASDEFIEVERAKILNNIITGNLEHPSFSVPFDSGFLPFPATRLGSAAIIQFLPLGGIVLATASRSLEIRENVISGNGESRFLPVNGIFILNGDGITIADNRIDNNGGKPTSSGSLSFGVRAGIAVMLAGTDFANDRGDVDNFLIGEFVPDNTGSALRIYNNTVRQPEGRGLHVVAIGPMAIENNFIASDGNHGSTSSASEFRDDFLIGDVVYAHDIGGPWELFDLDRHLTRPSGVAVMTGYTPAYHMLLTLGENPNVVPSPRLFIGVGGQVTFNNNQIVYDWSVRRIPRTGGAPLSFFPVVVFAMDHINMVGNQFSLELITSGEFDLPDVVLPASPTQGVAEPLDLGTPLFSNVLAAAPTVNVALNRFSESVGSTYLSLLANGDIMNATALNQSTHRIMTMLTGRAEGANEGATDTPTSLIATFPDNVQFAKYQNQILFTPKDHLGSVYLIIKLALQDFLVLTFDTQQL